MRAPSRARLKRVFVFWYCPAARKTRPTAFLGRKGGDTVSGRGLDMAAARLTDEAAEVIAGGVGGYAAECVAVDGGDAVVEPCKAADLREVTRGDGTGDSIHTVRAILGLDGVQNSGCLGPVGRRFLYDDLDWIHVLTVR